jgi:DNA (cytosine-5)-methyltransferase 1
MMIAGPECTNHSIAKGAARASRRRRRCSTTGPAATTSRTRAAPRCGTSPVRRAGDLAGQPLEAIVVENVVDAFKWGANDDGGLFNAWLTAIDALGYEHEIVWLNSMFAPPAPDPAPQSRDRMYVVFWLKGRKAPELRVEPPAWCPSLRAPRRRPAGVEAPRPPPVGPLRRAVPLRLPRLPRHRAARRVPGDLDHRRRRCRRRAIGERDRPLAPNTRERIRRGLERLSNEPFAIRLTHGGAPKPLTLPLVTLTQRHDLASSAGQHRDQGRSR